jgi:periplasmic divalent cation tolerance protein
MKGGGANRVVLVMCGKLSEARRIARGVTAKRLAACVNVLTSPAESFYTWKGKAERTREYLLMIKTTTGRLAELEAAVARMHSYEVPEFIVLPIIGGSKRYLDWLQAGVERGSR